MKKVIHKADTRGHSQYDWLDSYHTFSFDEYFDSDRINFGALRVLNDDKAVSYTHLFSFIIPVFYVVF